MKHKPTTQNPFLGILEVFEIVIGTIIALLFFGVSSRIAIGICQEWASHQ